MKHNNILEIIGRTPLLKINLDDSNRAAIFAKFEALNPSGSIKDRMALFMVDQAENKGILKPGMTIVEATTGNTGIAFSMIAAVKGYKMIAVMPENMSEERKKVMELFGAQVVLTSAKHGPKGAILKRNQLAKKMKSWVPRQFNNNDNAKSHELFIANEIISDFDRKIDVFIAGIGTGGSLMGIAKTLKKFNPTIKIIAVEPSESPVLSGGSSGNHNIQGIGEGFIPKLVNLALIDNVEKVSTSEAIIMARRLAQEEGLLVGFSSGANIAASLKIAKNIGKNKTIITLLPDRGERYLSELD